MISDIRISVDRGVIRACPHSADASVFPPTKTAIASRFNGTMRRTVPAGRQHRLGRAPRRSEAFRELGRQVIVDNRPGGSTIIGTDAVAKAPPGSGASSRPQTSGSI